MEPRVAGSTGIIGQQPEGGAASTDLAPTAAASAA